MTRAPAAALIALTSLVRIAAADDDVTESGTGRSVWTALRIGVVDAPFASATLREARSDSGQARLLRLGGATGVTGAMSVGAHVALAVPGVEQPAGSYRAATAWGNPTLFVEHARPRLADTIAPGLEGRLRLSIGLPLAGGGRDDQRALVIADALEGMREPALFTADVLPLVAAGSVRLHRDRLDARAGLALPLLLRVSERSVPDGAATAAVGFVPGVEGRVTVWPRPWFGASLGGAVSWPVIRPVYLAARRGSPQATVTPRLVLAIGSRLLLSLDIDVAAGGPLSGTASAVLGVRLGID